MLARYYRDYVLKFVIIGDASVGKSSLMVRLTDQRFLTKPDATLGVEFGSKLMYLPDEDKTVKLQCWDTAGTEYFRSITRSYYRGAAGALIVYDVTSRASFLHAEEWLKDVRAHADPNLTAILVANKVDLVPEEEENNAAGETEPRASTDSRGTTGRKSKGKRREVPREEAERWAKEQGILFIEASARTGANVEAAFDQAARDILRKIQQGAFDKGPSTGAKTGKPNPNALQIEATPKNSRCC